METTDLEGKVVGIEDNYVGLTFGKEYKELRFILDLNTHSKFIAKARRDNLTQKEAFHMMVNQYITNGYKII